MRRASVLFLVVGLVAGFEFHARSQAARSRPIRPVRAGRTGFTALEPSVSGLRFTNELRGDLYLTNAVAHNGAGVAAGDVDGDGLPDIYLCSLEGPNRLYRNLGGWRFVEWPLEAAACTGQISTGAVLADVDGDGDLDLLVNGIAAGTRLFLNDGKGAWAEARDSGLSRTASSTSMALGDIDGDGDLDLYCTHFIDAMMLADPTTRFTLARRGDRWEVTKVNGESTRSPRWRDRFEASSDGKVRELPEVHGFYRNEGGGRFRAIESVAGTYMNARGEPIPPYRDWGLAAMFRDMNGDGSPDLYVCNDNTSPDRIWINTGKGTFREAEAGMFRHTSRSSMGVDFADVDRDGRDDLVVVDMLAREPSRRMRQLVRDRPTLAEAEQVDGRPQYNRNTLFLGRPGGRYVEVAFFAGVAATDWTWAPLFMDVDLDGLEDLLVTNGFEFDVMDQDSSNEIKDPKRRLTEAQLKRSMQMHPRWRTRNVAFRNRGGARFEAVGPAWGFDHEGVSFGMAQADFDQDGDLDLVVNNLNEAASLYRNDAPAERVAVRLKGRPPNTSGTGARIELIEGTRTQAQEMLCGGRYLSGDEALRVFAILPDRSGTSRLVVHWRSGVTSRVEGVEPNRIYEISEPAVGSDAPTAGREASAVNPAPMFEDISRELGHVHHEDPNDDWVRQPMLPRRLSRLGPGVGWWDADGDGWEDLAIGTGRGDTWAVYRNLGGSGWRRQAGGKPALDDQGSVLGWPDGRGGRFWLVSEGNLERVPEVPSALKVHATTNLESALSLPAGEAHTGPMALADVDGDGDLDVFVGGRCRGGRYPEAVSSSLWLNQGGTLVMDRTWSAPFRDVGMVSGATFVDLNDDGRQDLVLAVEWGPVKVFINRSGGFSDETAAWGLGGWTGWWTGVVAGDFDGDGRIDLACGNWGRNTPYELMAGAELRLHYGEWNGDGAMQLIEAWRVGTNGYPVRDRAWLGRGMPELLAQFPTHAGFGKATMAEILGPVRDRTRELSAAHLSSVVLFNRGTRFEPVELPPEAQWSPVFGIAVGDMDGDGADDLFLAQNFFGSASDLSREDAGVGLWLRGNGRGGWEPVDPSVSGVLMRGEQRGAALADVNHDGRVDLVVAQNSAETKLYLNRRAAPGLRVVLAGAAGNPDGVGAQVRVVYRDGTMGPSRAVQAGSGYWSQDSAVPVLGLRGLPAAVRVRWPGGRVQTMAVPDGAREIRMSEER